MAEDRMAVLETVRKAIADGDVDFLREGVRVLAQAVMEAEVTELTGRAPGRARPGAPADPAATATASGAGTPGWARSSWPSRGSATARYFPSLLEPRRRAERALLAVVQEAYVAGRQHPPGRGPRRGARASPGISKSEVSRICAALDAEVEAFRQPPARRRGVSLPVARRHVRQGPRGAAGSCRWRRSSRPASRATGERRVLGLELAAGNDEGSRLAGASSASLVERGLRGVRLVISDDHAGLVKAVARAAPGRRAGSAAGSTSRATPRTSCPRSARSMVATAIRLDLRAARRGARPGRSSAGHRRPRGRASRRSPSCSPRPRPTCSPTSRSPRPTAARSAAPTRSSGSTRRSSAAPRWSGIFPNRASRHPPGRAWSSPSRTTSGRTAGATSGPRRWPLIDAVIDHEEVSPALLMAS